MSCAVDVETHLQREILDLPHRTGDEIVADMVALQENPLPPDRKDLSSDSPWAYFHQLPSGYFVSWELIGQQEDILDLLRGRPCQNLIIRVLGIGTDSPK